MNNCYKNNTFKKRVHVILQLKNTFKNKESKEKCFDITICSIKFSILVLPIKNAVLNILSFFILLGFSQCNNEEEIKPRIRKIDREKLKRQFEYANQRVIQKEIDEMDFFEKTHQMPFVRTNFGVRYYIYDSIKGQSKIKDGDEITMNYTISLLDGTICYTDEGKTKTFIVGGEHIESGIHKVMPYLHYGDKAYILIPSHLAHGLLGDLSKIPPQSPILYKVEIFKRK